MAIIPGFPGVEVTIAVGELVVHEYSDPAGGKRGVLGAIGDAIKRISKFIEAKDKEGFVIRLKVTSDYDWRHKNHSLNIAVLIDGKWVKGELCRSHNTHTRPWERDISHRIIKNPLAQTGYVSQTFEFTTIKHIENAAEDQIDEDALLAKQLGSIEVLFYRTVETDGREIMPPPSGNEDKEVAVSTESMKGMALSHGTSYANTTPTLKPSYVKCDNIEEDHGPIAVFQFNYRSREALIQEGVSPRPSHSRGQSRGLPGLSREEIDGLAHRQLNRSKQAASGSADNDELEERLKAVKDEISARDAAKERAAQVLQDRLLKIKEESQVTHKRQAPPPEGFFQREESSFPEILPVKREQRQPREKTLTRIDNLEEGDDIDDVPLKSEGLAADATISRDIGQTIVIDGEDEGHEEKPQIHQAPEAMISRGFGETIVLDKEEKVVPKGQPAVGAQRHSKNQAIVIDDEDETDRDPIVYGTRAMNKGKAKARTLPSFERSLRREPAIEQENKQPEPTIEQEPNAPVQDAINHQTPAKDKEDKDPQEEDLEDQCQQCPEPRVFFIDEEGNVHSELSKEPSPAFQPAHDEQASGIHAAEDIEAAHILLSMQYGHAVPIAKDAPIDENKPAVAEDKPAVAEEELPVAEDELFVAANEPVAAADQNLDGEPMDLDIPEVMVIDNDDDNEDVRPMVKEEKVKPAQDDQDDVLIFVGENQSATPQQLMNDTDQVLGDQAGNIPVEVFRQEFERFSQRMFNILDGQQPAAAPAQPSLPSFERFNPAPAPLPTQTPSVNNNASGRNRTMTKQEILTKRQLDEMDEQVDLSAPLWRPRPHKKSKTAAGQEIIDLIDSDDE
ncbi:Uu.00g072280.m01.CDS01 [Anthostomella pinea]|uniref:Uu.00g072280.m01.CDS01 n=1 Tax=Anthostomella pinea TaxID=933095 RepID=A0AAI8VV33_9PEZI|nr:Uu.00g072280.m01.CDS01 [Anthostomella pinea]